MRIKDLDPPLSVINQSVLKPGCSVEISGVPCSPKSKRLRKPVTARPVGRAFSLASMGDAFPGQEDAKIFPSRPVLRHEFDMSISEQKLEAWFTGLKLEPILGPLVPSPEDRIRVLRLLHRYRHLNREDLSDLPCTDLVEHRVRIHPQVKPHAVRFQKRWPPHTQWWIQKLTSDGIAGGIYESTMIANGQLSEWNARPVMVDKVENPQPTDEPRITIDYSRVIEVLPGAHLERCANVHDNLSNPSHGYLFSADLKHAYLTVPLHKGHRHYFAFTVPGFGQLQPTRMQPGSQSGGFTMTELIYRGFGPIPSTKHLAEPSLLHSSDPGIPPSLTFYMDDFFGGFPDFESLFKFLKDHFFPRVEWARLLLSFRKLRLFMEQIKALGVGHCIGGGVKILDERIARIIQWPVPKDQSTVRAFLGTIVITKRWVKNFTEWARPLTRFTGKAPWRWGNAEQLSFELLKILCATRTLMRGINLQEPIHMYCDASGRGAGLCICQAKAGESSQLEAPVLYDSFPFNASQQKYPTYKRELCAIVKFCSKYDYLYKHPYRPAIIHTDHRPLTYFLKSNLHEGIYGHWADVLRRLNVHIVYIPGYRNRAADGLSRTLFNEECSDTPLVATVHDQL